MFRDHRCRLGKSEVNDVPESRHLFDLTIQLLVSFNYFGILSNIVFVILALPCLAFSKASVLPESTMASLPVEKHPRRRFNTFASFQ